MELSPSSRGFSAAWLKYFAAFFMLIDHTDAIFHLTAALSVYHPLLFYLPRLFGRLSFPIFAFFVAEGCHKTHDFPQYLKRLALFAVIAEYPYILALGQGSSVILTFFLAAAGIYCYERLRGRFHLLAALLPMLAAAVLAELLSTDYGVLGVLTICTVYLCGDSRKRQLVCLAICLLFIYLFQTELVYWVQPVLALLQGQEPTLIWPRFFADLSGWMSFRLPFNLLMTGSACLALIPLCLYNGQRGRGSKWFFYWFYPVHLLLLGILRMLK